MRRPTSIEKGFYGALLVVVGCCALAMPAVNAVPAPSVRLMDGIASLGTGLLLAYVVEAVWATRQMRSAHDYEKRLGFLVGLATTGLAGIVIALLVSAHLAAGHSNLLDVAGLAWVVVSLGLLGGFVVTQPLLGHEWSSAEEGDRAR